MLLEGLFLPVTTPFHADGRLHLRKLQANIARYSLTPAAGMVMLGTAGEGSALDDHELTQVLESAISAAADPKVMLCEVGKASVVATLRVIEAAASFSFDAVIVNPPELRGAETLLPELLTFFEVLADHSPIPIIVGQGTPVQALARIAQHPCIIGSVEAGSRARIDDLRAQTSTKSREVTVTPVFSAVTARMLRRSAQASLLSPESLGAGAHIGVAGQFVTSTPTIKTRTKRVGFQVLAADTTSMLEAWQAGASGAISRVAACAPQGACEVWQAWRDGDLPLALEKQERIREAAVLMEGPRGISAVKYGCDFNGYFGGRPRLPLLPPAAATRAAVESALASLRT